MTVRDWDGASYDRVSETMQAMGAAVLERLQLDGEERVLDAGCGSGRVTQMLIARVPRGHVIGVDSSQSMIDAARERLGEGADLRTLDLLELELEQPVDAVLCTATLHWIADHQRVFERLRGVLRAGGQLAAQCGGSGNLQVLRSRVARVSGREPYSAHFERWQPPWNYQEPEPTHRRLLAAGFASARCWLEPAPARPQEPREYLQTIVLGPLVQRLPQPLRERYMDEVMAELGSEVLVDYVRLNIDAIA